MKAISTEIRKVRNNSGEITFTFERKNIKNINLRVRHNGSVYVSAPKSVCEEKVDAFVLSKFDYIRNALDNFSNSDIPQTELQYISGENVTFLGKNMRINVVKDNREYVNCDGVYVYIHVQRPDYYNRKKNLLNKWLDEQSLIIFSEIMQKVHSKFGAYNIPFPQLKIRNMTSRWGSCQPYKSIITLNKRLIEAPKNCIEYVLYHEFCHFVHPNHSKQFYELLQVMLPNWQIVKISLENTLINKPYI